MTPDPYRQSQPALPRRAFELLETLHRRPVKATWTERKEEFRTALIEPFARLIGAVALLLPGAMRTRLETERRITSRLLKNDYGRGGAWDYYWGAFYPHNSRRTLGPQLYIRVERGSVEYGFAIGEDANPQRRRFESASRRYFQPLLTLLEATLHSERLQFGWRPEEGTSGSKRSRPAAPVQFREWFSAPLEHGVRVAVIRSREEVLATPAESLAVEVAATFEELYPFVLLATLPNPLPEIERWLGVERSDGAGRVGEAEDVPYRSEYTLRQCARDTGIAEEQLDRWVRAIERKGQAIVYGPPGTGKTWLAQHLARHLVSGGDGIVETVQFHPAYGYEEFIQGIRPHSTGQGILDYRMTPGRFLEFCVRARERSGRSVMIIDEMNRADLARVFGELLYLLEYRAESIPLAAGERFTIPPTVRIIGTMNTADRSIALLDHALRRRFAFLELRPDYTLLVSFHRAHSTGVDAERLAEVLRRLNAEIGDAHYEVGISYFLRSDLAATLPDVWRMEIEPYLAEYFFDQPGRAGEFSWEMVREMLGW